jgi:aryl-phospho-beta-D-glucosidase BglC (GH1 family)
MAGICKSMDDYNYKKDKNGDPLIKDCQTTAFFNYYTSPEALSIFRALWYNQQGMQDKYVAFWAKVATQLGNNVYVIGFDPINEPMFASKSWYKTLY